jgi:hypothetical protein
MEEVLAGQPNAWYAKPADVVQVGNNSLSANYYLPNTITRAYSEIEGCPGAYDYKWNGVC